MKISSPATGTVTGTSDLAAYVTDLSTGRTEQRRFQLRLSAQPIHLYMLASDVSSADAPLALYVTSSYADDARVSGWQHYGRPPKH